jgi:hypothetical protein
MSNLDEIVEQLKKIKLNELHQAFPQWFEHKRPIYLGFAIMLSRLFYIPNTRQPDEELFKSLMKEINKKMREAYKNHNTMSSYSSFVRKPIREMFGSHTEYYRISNELLGLNQYQLDKKNLEYARKINQQLMNRGDIPAYSINLIKRLVFDPFPINQSINALKNSKDFDLKIVVSLMLATGSRLIEVFTADFLPDYWNATNSVYVSNLAKRNENTTFRRLNLLNIEQFADLWTYCQTNINPYALVVQTKLSTNGFEGITNDRKTLRVHNNFNDRINRYLLSLQIAQDLDGNPATSHTLRYIAAELNFILYGQGAEETTYKSKYFGHIAYSSVQPYLRIRLAE